MLNLNFLHLCIVVTHPENRARVILLRNRTFHNLLLISTSIDVELATLIFTTDIVLLKMAQILTFAKIFVN